MTILESYLEYADAFEESFADDDWSHVEPYFAADAVYDGDPPANGRDAVLAKFKNGVDAFDRRMDSRTPVFQTPVVKGNTLTVKWTVTYTKKGVPDLVISGVETAEFKGDRIMRLRDDFDPGVQKSLGDWMTRHGKTLQGG